MKNLILSVLLLIVGTSALAANTSAVYMKCNGVDTAGKRVYLISYPYSSTVNINGDILNIVGTTRNGKGVVTEDFVNVFGVLVYDSLVPINDYLLNIYQFNAVTNALLAQARLTCNFYGYAANTKKSIFDHPALKDIKPSALAMADIATYSKAQ